MTITCTAELAIDGTDALGDHDWDDDSHCRCPDCGCAGQVAKFRLPQKHKERKRP